MTRRPVPTEPESATTARLDGWKEIAAHFRKGVRTVQRWEKDLGLPVRRMGTGRGEVVFAFRAELDAWLAALEKGTDLDGRPGEEAADAAGAVSQPVPGPVTSNAAAGRPPARSRKWLAVALGAVGIAAAAGAWYFLPLAPDQPYVARVERGALSVYDEAGRRLWQRRLSFPLADSPDAELTRKLRPATRVVDLEGDGSAEVLLITNAEGPGVPGGLLCYDRRGRLRFQHVTAPRNIRYGGVPATGPWHPTVMAVTAEADGRTFIWVASLDRDQFQTVVEKIDAGGRVVSEFHHPGNVTVLLPMVFHGRPVMLVGACSNEFNGAALAVLDAAAPRGTGPAVKPKYVCEGCPRGQPLAYVVFPGTEIERIQDNTTGVNQIWRGDGGEVNVVVGHTIYFNVLGRGDGYASGDTHYLLDADLRPLVAQHQPSFRALHDEAFRRGVLNHPFDPLEDAALFPLLRWNGTAFEELPRPGAPAR